MSSSKRKTLHRRLLRVIAYALALAIVLSGVLIGLIGKQSAEQYSEQNLTVISKILAEKSAFPLSLGLDYADEATESLNVARYNNELAKVCLYDARGKLFSEYLASDTNKQCYDSLATNKNPSDSQNRYSQLSARVVTPVSLSEEIVGHIVVESKGKRLKNILVAMTLAIFGSLFFALVVALLFGSRQLREALKGLRNLHDTSVAIAADPFSVERASKHSNDEIGDLAQTFNRMLDTLERENKLLKTSENTFRTLSENAPVGVFLRTSPNSYEYVNSTWSKMTGLNMEQSEKFTDQISDEYKRDYIQKIASLKTENKFVVTEFQYRHRSHEKSRYLQEYVSVLTDGQDTFYIGTLIDISELKASQIELEQLAYFDPLTSLPNRRFLSDHLSYSFAAAERKQSKIAVFMTDLDNFKRVNDTLGHDAGDKLLVTVSDRLKKAVFREDVVSRMGGDEFLILIDEIENLNAIEFISNQLLQAMRTEAKYEGSSIPVTGSIGVAIYPDDSSSAEDLLRHADIALYHSKENGGDQFSCYSDKLDQAIREQIRLEQKLRKALDENRIEVYFQPQVIAAEERTCWVEALARWHDPEEGFIPPDRFISIAEETGLIIELGNCVLNTVCRTFREHELELRSLGIQGVSVNLSAKQFFSETLLSDIESILSTHGMEAQNIDFELTESTVTEDVEKAIQIMQSIRKLGCQLSIDDFGTGYSSLSYLSKYPLTNLKIDRSFVDKLPGSKNDEEIACTIISLAHNLGMKVVAEGVETAAQAQYLREQGCEYLQGFYYSKPLPIDHLLDNSSAKKRTLVADGRTK